MVANMQHFKIRFGYLPPGSNNSLTDHPHDSLKIFNYMIRDPSYEDGEYVIFGIRDCKKGPKVGIMTVACSINLWHKVT